ncbi:GNAT family N-acetyltransferase [Sporosalibacterium faouarense]|uniref:GNAT family N-acetyltransferase n=1 Tax=Sporosalibacterium faouarense TaxID=516123 RepID=UPI00192C2148|nr:GNAT family N-acetyltransferase [Sporosalibacterium faouarense]
MEYRIATSNDLYSLADMRWEFKTEGKEINPNNNKSDFIKSCVDFLEEGIEDKSWIHWIVVDNSEIISHISVRRIRKIPKPNKFFDEYGYLTNVFTKENYRGKGIGSKLMSYVIEWAKEEDLETLIVWPSDRAINFYERKGFRIQSDVMELELRQSID